MDRPLLSIWGATEDTICGVQGLGPGPSMRMIPEAEVRIVGQDGTPVADGELGEMLIRSPGTSPGYWMGPGRIESFPEG